MNWNFFRSLLPPGLRGLIRRARKAHQNMRASKRSNAEVFTDIYLKNLWGGKAGEFYSGSGSVGERASAYVTAVASFMQSHSIREVVDIGCGDFRIGNSLVNATAIEKYIGLDVVAPLIERNRQLYANDKIEFHCLDATLDPLPPGDLCLLRQVLQHLSNAEVATILRKVRTNYRFVLITEHHPKVSAKFRPNLDLTHGPEARNKINSGIFPHLPPFDFPEPEILVEVEPWNCPDEKIVTMLFRFSQESFSGKL